MEKQISASLAEMMPLIKEALENGQSIRIYPYGISMLPMLRQGTDSVVLSGFEKLKKYDIILYQRENGKYVLHRIVGVGDTYTCIGDNQFVFEKGISRGQIIAVCSSFTRGEKEYSAKAFVWRAYAVFWHYSRFTRRATRAIKRRIKAFLKKK